MNNNDQMQDEHAQLSKDYGEIFYIVNEILFRHDPIGINFGSNTDEYEPEVRTILPRIGKCATITQLQSTIYEEFVSWFQESAGDENQYGKIAEEVWHAWRDFQFPWIQADVTMLSPEEGGKHHPIQLDSGGFYRPHLVVGPISQRNARISEGNRLTEDYLGIQFRPGTGLVMPGSTITIKLELMYFPYEGYRKLVPDAEFTIREGSLICGYGTVREIGYIYD